MREKSSLEPTVHATPWLEAPASEAAPAQDSPPALGGENTFSTSVQPVQIAKTHEIDTAYPLIDRSLPPRETTAAKPFSSNINNAHRLSPKDQAELAHGMLRVVVSSD